MNENQAAFEKHPQSSKPDKGKKPYQKPEFRHEQVFETRALSCGKIAGTQGTCQSNTSAS